MTKPKQRTEIQGSTVVGALILLRSFGGSLRRQHTEELRKDMNRRDVREEAEGAHGFDLSDTELM